MLGIMNLSKTIKYRTLKNSIYNLIISYKSVFSKTLESNGSILVVILVVVFFIKKIILFKTWSHISYFQAVRKCTASLKRFINPIDQHREWKLTFLQNICWDVPVDRFLALTIIDNLLHIIYKNRLKQKFTGNIKILFDCFDARMIIKLN